MIKFEHLDIHGWEAAIRGMRNAMESWDKSDSYWTYIENPETGNRAKFEFFVGDNDLKLMRTLANAGPDHGKYLRYITVSLDITAPLYWWKEFETYRIGVAENPSEIEFNSCSTMHKIHVKEFTREDFSWEHLNCGYKDCLDDTIEGLNNARKQYLCAEKVDRKSFWWQMIQLLPSSYNQKRTVQLSYQALRNIYHARKNHKLDEWRFFCEYIRSFPYSELITGGDSE